MNAYREMKYRHQEEVNALPLHFAFSKKQFEEEMKSMGLDPYDDIDKLYKGIGGSFYLKTDSQTINSTLARHQKEFDDAVASDETGNGFIFDMFLEELNNHEFSYTGDPDEAVYALGFDYDDLEKSLPLMNGFKKACAAAMA